MLGLSMETWMDHSIRSVQADKHVRVVGEDDVHPVVGCVDPIHTEPAVENIPISAADEGVVTFTAFEEIATIPTVEKVVPGAADQVIVALLAMEFGPPALAGAGIHDDLVVAGASENEDGFAIDIVEELGHAVDL